MKATEANQITKVKREGYDKIIYLISEAASKGDYQLDVNKFLDQTIINRLKEDGYEVYFPNDIMGNRLTTIVSWHTV